MAGDWIKMRTDLGTSPKVVRLSSALKADRFRIVGGLHSVWCLFDAHSDDGVLVGYTTEVLDDLVGWPGFSEAMIAVGWLDNDGESLALPRFEAHNGQSAKRRAQDADRKRVQRMSASKADDRPQKVCPRGEESREDIKAKSNARAEHALEGEQDGEKQDPPADPKAKPRKRITGSKPAKTAARFAEFYAAYPVKKQRATAEAAWKKQGLDGIADEIIEHVRKMEREDVQWRTGFIPHPATYLNQQRWTDEPQSEVKQATVPAPSPDKFGAKAAMTESETPLERAINYARQQRNLQAISEEEMKKMIAEATERYRGQHGQPG